MFGHQGDTSGHEEWRFTDECVSLAVSLGSAVFRESVERLCTEAKSRDQRRSDVQFRTDDSRGRLAHLDVRRFTYGV